MDNNYHRTADWLTACGKVPSAEDASTQIGCDIEEQVEFLECLMLNHDGNQSLLDDAIRNLKRVAKALKSGSDTAFVGEGDRVNALDALCDREVTGNGVAHLLGFNKPMADQAVLESNEAKLVDGEPIILEGGKIGKPDGWTAPDLSEFV